ncbi:hypothetical protein PIB30_114834, partial [Stylosanthes scabra]|nr:hypothetical protein [Stylosanthes scabra]
MDDGDAVEDGDGQGVYADANGAQQPLTYTLEEVMKMEFENPEAAIRFYEAYSRAMGFSMRHGRKLRNKAGEVVRYTFLCNREGFR